MWPRADDMENVIIGLAQGSIRRNIPDWATAGLATAEDRGHFCRVQSSKFFFYMITAHGLHLMGGSRRSAEDCRCGVAPRWPRCA
jgi:hypothetical protein